MDSLKKPKGNNSDAEGKQVLTHYCWKLFDNVHTSIHVKPLKSGRTKGWITVSAKCV
jgi:hypothetical protein